MIFSGLFTAATLFLTALPSLAYYPQGYITVPANGSHVEPGQAFDFTYNARGDYCLTSHNYTVWVLTAPPTSVLQIENNGVTGEYLGRFSSSGICEFKLNHHYWLISNSLTIPIANEFPSNPPPPQLVMPDFSKNLGGFSQGAFASDLPVYLAVIEEFNECGVSPRSNVSWICTDNTPFHFISPLLEATSAWLSTR